MAPPQAQSPPAPNKFLTPSPPSPGTPQRRVSIHRPYQGQQQGGQYPPAYGAPQQGGQYPPPYQGQQQGQYPAYGQPYPPQYAPPRPYVAQKGGDAVVVPVGTVPSGSDQPRDEQQEHHGRERRLTAWF